MAGSLLCSSCGEGWGIHNLIQIDGLVWLVGRLRQDSTQASGWREINYEIMCTQCSMDCYSTALFTIGYMHHTVLRAITICIYSACNLRLIVSSHCKLVGVVFFVWFRDCLHSCVEHSFNIVNLNLLISIVIIVFLSYLNAEYISKYYTNYLCFFITNKIQKRCWVVPKER